MVQTLLYENSRNYRGCSRFLKRPVVKTKKIVTTIVWDTVLKDQSVIVVQMTLLDMMSQIDGVAIK